jgi:hypothetical protein
VFLGRRSPVFFFGGGEVFEGGGDFFGGWGVESFVKGCASRFRGVGRSCLLDGLGVVRGSKRVGVVFFFQGVWGGSLIGEVIFTGAGGVQVQGSRKEVSSTSTGLGVVRVSGRAEVCFFFEGGGL